MIQASVIPSLVKEIADPAPDAKPKAEIGELSLQKSKAFSTEHPSSMKLKELIKTERSPRTPSAPRVVPTGSAMSGDRGGDADRERK